MPTLKLKKINNNNKKEINVWKKILIQLLLLDLVEKTRQMSKDKKAKPRQPQWSLIFPTAERQNQVCKIIWQGIYNIIGPSLGRVML